MGFWQAFEDVYMAIFEIIDTPMNIGGFSFSFWDVLIASGACTVIGMVVGELLDDD